MSTRSRSVQMADTDHRRDFHGSRTSSTVFEELELVNERRNSLLSEKRAAVERVMDKHDDLVRESFHMEKFVSMLAYDPKVAKQDNSAVYQEYKAQYDLVDRFSSAGPSRSTRRAHNAMVDALMASTTPTDAASPPSTKKARTAGGDDTPAFWSTISGVKSRDKGKGRVGADTDRPLAPGPGQKGKGKPHTAFTDSYATNGHEEQSSRGTRPRKRPPDPRLRPAVANDQDMPSPRKKRRLDHHDTTPSPESVSTVPKRALRKSHLFGESDSISSFSSSSKTPLKRIKLIVRRPQPSYSSPNQRPPPAPHGASVFNFLSTYIAPEGRDLSAEEITRRISQINRFWSEIKRQRALGRLVFVSYLDAIDPDTGHYVRGSTPEPRRLPDAWDGVLEDVVNGRGRPVSGVALASQLAAHVMNHWISRNLVEVGGSAGAVTKKPPVKGKGKDSELVRLKKLAKVTAGMVVDEWKRVVLHIREEERRRIRAEEQRRGQEHLSAMLDQSDKILRAQQADLTRDYSVSMSRSSPSSSVRSPSPHGGDDDEEADSDDETDAVESDSEVDTGLLLGHVSVASLSRSVSADSGIVDSPAVTEDTGDHSPSSESRAKPGDFVLSHSPSSPDDAPCTPAPIDDHHPLPLIVDNASHGHGDRRAGSPLPVTKTPDLLMRKESITMTEVQVDSSGISPLLNGAPILTETAPVVSDHPSDEPILPYLVDTPSTADLEERAAQALRSAMQHPGVAAAPDLDIPLDEDEVDDVEVDTSVPSYLRRYAVTSVEWDSQVKMKPPQLLRGVLRPYQYAGLEWLASLHTSNMNGILADEMGLGKTIQTIALLAHLACDRGIWGPHLIIVPTSVLLNWEMEFKKFLPGFKVLSYHGNMKRRKELRQGWYNKHNFNVCVTSYTLATRDQNMFKRKPWYYMILDEAHMIKNFKSQRWNTLLFLPSWRRLLLTGTPLQNNLTELWALLQFLMSGTSFANLKEFSEWFSNPLEKAIEMGTALDDQNQQTVSQLHTILRPYLLRRLKRDVEKELPSKFEHLVMCPLSKRQRFLYDEFMSRAETRFDLQSGVYQKIANILMQLRKVVNHPDLFEVRPVKTSFAMPRCAIADFEIKELLVRRRLLLTQDDDPVSHSMFGFRFVERDPSSSIVVCETRRLNATHLLPHYGEQPEPPPPYDARTVVGYRKFRTWHQRQTSVMRWLHLAYVNYHRCNRHRAESAERIRVTKSLFQPLLPLEAVDKRFDYMTRVDHIHAAIKSYSARAEEMSEIINRFAFVTPAVVARDLASIALVGAEGLITEQAYNPTFDAPIHRSSVKLQIAFPDPSLLQYDCGKLQQLADLLRERKAGGHRVLIFTQMTRVLDILETFLNFHGYLYLRLDGSTKIEDRQYVTERFNSDSRMFCFISSSRSGGVGINLTGADTVIFYDSDFNPQMDRQCEDRAHRIGQIRDVHIYRFISSHTVEEALLRKANQKRSLDNLVIQKGEFDWRTVLQDEDDRERGALTRALGEFEDVEDARAAKEAEKEEVELVGRDEVDFTGEAKKVSIAEEDLQGVEGVEQEYDAGGDPADPNAQQGDEEEDEEEGSTTVEYMLSFIRYDMDYFNTWSL